MRLERPVEADGLICPECGNDDPSALLLFAETIETDRYLYERTENGVPVFAYGKSAHTDPGPEPPSAECSRCHTMWTPAAGSYELH